MPSAFQNLPSGPTRPGNLSPNPTAHPVGTERLTVLHTAPSGRHRGSTRYNPWSELSTIVKSAGQNSVKATAVLAASGGLVATFALPAQAEPSRARVTAPSSAAPRP